MFKAEEARKVAKDTNKILVDMQLKQIIDIIKRVAKEGKLSTIVTISLLPEVYTKLVDLGYKIEKYKNESRWGEMTSPSTTISW